MTNLTGLFKESDTSLGIFYPKHYVVAALADPTIVHEAAHALTANGRAQEDIIVLPAAEALQFFEEFRANAGATGEVMRGVSRFLGDDATFVDADIDRAKRGAGLVMVYCPTEQDAHKVRDLLLPFQPLSMRWYDSSGILSLV